MEPALMMQTATGLLAVSATGGVIMAAIRFGGQPQPPTWLAMLHGFLSAAALTLLVYACFTVGLPAMAQLALLLFLVAAAGGAYLNLNFHWKMQALPKWLVLVHAGIAVCGFLLLVVSTWKISHH